MKIRNHREYCNTGGNEIRLIEPYIVLFGGL